MANPTWFDAKVYMANKLAQLVATDPKGSWTEEKLTKAMDEAGFKDAEGAFKHFEMYGMDENVSPNAMFNVAEYLQAKAEQLNGIKFEGKVWTSVMVLDAIKAAGMNAWEHYDLYGSKEGINPSNAFNAESYIAAKTVLMNETKEGGRANWTIDEVKAAFEANGFSALEHYNLFGKDEFKAAGKEAQLEEIIKVKTPVTVDKDFDALNGAQKFTLEAALDAKNLPVNYILTDGDTTAVRAGSITVEQFNGMKDFIAKAVNGADYAKATVSYGLDDTVANIDAAAPSVIAGSDINNDGKKGDYNITDTLANVAMGNNDLVNQAAKATAKIVLGAEAGTDVNTTVKYADIADNLVSGTSKITLAATDDKAPGTATVTVDGTGNASTIKTVDMGSFFKNADAADDKITLKYVASAHGEAVTGTDAADIIVAGAKGNAITGGKGADQITLGDGADVVKFAAVTDSQDLATAGMDKIFGFDAKADKLIVETNVFTSGTAASSVVKFDYIDDGKGNLWNLPKSGTDLFKDTSNKQHDYAFGTYTGSDGQTYTNVYVDVDRDGTYSGDKDMVIQLVGTITLTDDNFTVA